MDFAIVEKQALTLPAEQRAVLADHLIASILPNDEQLKNNWIVESQNRLNAFNNGQIDAIDGNKIVKTLRKKLS
jgi:hypothetical protein